MTTTKLITQLELWYDVGFTEGSVEVPSVSASLQSADLTLTAGWNPSTDRIFSSIELKEEYADLMNVSYARLTYNFKAGTKTFYAWVDSVTLKSDSEDFPMIVLTFHIDLWRTFISQAEFGYGLVMKRPQGSADPPQSLAYRYRLPGDFTTMKYTGYGKEANWVIINYAEDNGTLTKVQTAVFPIAKRDVANAMYFKVGANGTMRTALLLADLIDGSYATDMGIAASTIASVFISPVPPVKVTSGTGTSADPFIIESSAGTTTVTGSNTLAYVTTLYVYSNSGVAFNGQVRFNKSDGSVGSDQYYSNESTLKSIFASYSGVTAVQQGSGLTFDFYQTVNGVQKSFVFTKNIDTFVSENLASQGMSLSDLSAGDTFTLTNAVAYPSVSLTQTAAMSGSHQQLTNAYTTSGTGVTTVTWNGSTFGSYTVLSENSSMYWSLTTSSPSSDVNEGQGGSPVHYWIYSSNMKYPEYSQSLASAKVTTDTVEWIMTDMTGEPIGSIPWGISVQAYTVRCVISATSAYLEYRFRGLDSHVTGVNFVISLPPVDLASNSWSEYVYSGQRDYDVEQRKIARDQALIQSVTGSALSVGQFRSGIVNSGTEAANSASAAGLTGAKAAVGIGAGLVAGLGAGIGAGALLGLASGAVDYAIQGDLNNKLQNAEDTLKAKQLDSIIMSGIGWDWMWNGRDPGLISMVADDYSLQKFSAKLQLNGIDVSEVTQDCTSLINAGGPLQIENLNVIGDIPIEAKRYIKNRFHQGVRIV